MTCFIAIRRASKIDLEQSSNKTPFLDLGKPFDYPSIFLAFAIFTSTP